MGWVQEQNTGAAGSVFRGVWFKDELFAFVQRSAVGLCGVWHRDGIGPWTHTRAGNHPTYWEADGAFYTGGYGVGVEAPKVYRSVDGINWVLDWTIPGGWIANPGSGIHGMEAYDDYLYCFCNDIGVDATVLRRDRAGVWTDLPTGLAPELTPESTRGVVEFGGTRYWTDSGFVRYWTGAAWVAEPTLDGNCGGASWMSIIDNILYIGASYAWSPYGGGYYWKTPGATNWSFLKLPTPDNTWSINPLCLGGDGEIYTYTEKGTELRIYRKDGPGFTLVSYETGLALGGPGGVCVEPDGTTYFGMDFGLNVRFYEFVGVYNVTPSGGGLYPQSMDADGDGNTLYVGLYDTTTAQPLLISVALPLDGATSTGNAMFAPGAGDAINVKCTDVGDELAVSGWFGLDEQVEATTDAGLNWAYTDPAAWDNERAQPLIVAPLTTDEIMVALDNLQELHETFDVGVNWVQRNAAIGFTPSAMDKMDNGTEMIIGDGAGNQIDYSPNRGVSTANITGVFAGNVAALEIT